MPIGDTNPNSPKRLSKSYASSRPEALRTRAKVAMVRKLMAKGRTYDEAYREATAALGYSKSA